MTDAEVETLEAYWRAQGVGADPESALWREGDTLNQAVAQVLDRDVYALVAEVRRLRGLVVAAEWLGPVLDQRASCPWCLLRQPRGHADNCPAFPLP